MSGLILQFGTSRFLQAHVDLFADEARRAGQDVPPIVIVQTSGTAERAGRVAAFGNPDGYPVIVRGLVDGTPVDRTHNVQSVVEGLSAARDWPRIMRLFAGEATYVVSNTGDTGYAVAEQAEHIDALIETCAAPQSFPAKLLVLLCHRWQSGARPITMLPCELIPHNGAVLRDIVLRLGREASLPSPCLAWIERDVIWADTLVDRIVSAPIEPIGAVAEPYALWVIEQRPGLIPPFDHPSLILTDDLMPFERLKLHILNLIHTVLADIWLKDGRRKDETVREILADPAIAARLDALLDGEVIPGFAHRDMGAAAGDYVRATMDRLHNPHLDHRIADIAQNHGVKIARRIGGFLDWITERSGTPPTPILHAMAGR